MKQTALFTYALDIGHPTHKGCSHMISVVKNWPSFLELEQEIAASALHLSSSNEECLKEVGGGHFKGIYFWGHTEKEIIGKTNTYLLRDYTLVKFIQHFYRREDFRPNFEESILKRNQNYVLIHIESLASNEQFTSFLEGVKKRIEEDLLLEIEMALDEEESKISQIPSDYATTKAIVLSSSFQATYSLGGFEEQSYPYFSSDEIKRYHYGKDFIKPILDKAKEYGLERAIARATEVFSRREMKNMENQS
ncbi:MAG: hypothetical protein V2A62_00200 [Candidatus Woesearchaeota archaeon]